MSHYASKLERSFLEGSINSILSVFAAGILAGGALYFLFAIVTAVVSGRVAEVLR